jgi:hypothetical protein
MGRSRRLVFDEIKAKRIIRKVGFEYERDIEAVLTIMV